ncbi:alpha/beta fold hydrolase [Actinospongicola halichondriae]|uniref:alpha/beta fold hydrolase n=1 Tax=Actinospongicola halichondriae TaxID=3236844 RepID=UPI003D4CC238
MWLHADRDGEGDPVVLVHGFTQTRNCWGPIADDLRQDHTVVRVDAPGHGRSAELMAGLRGGGRLIADQGGEAVYVGYSMGGRYLIHLALGNPELVRGLVLIGATPGIEDPAERAERAAADLATGRRIRELGLLDFLKAWIAAPMFAGLPSEHQFLLERMENTVEGLENSVIQAGTGRQDPSWDKLHRFSMPVLVVAGEDDEKYAAIGRRMADAIGANATLAIIPGAGHAAHLERSDEFLAVLRTWMTENGL